MDDTQLDADNAMQTTSGDSFQASSVSQYTPISGLSSPSSNYPLEDLEIHNILPSSHVSQTLPKKSSLILAFSRRKAMIVSLVLTALVMGVTGVSILFLARKAPKSQLASQNTVQTQDVSLKDATIATIPAELQGTNESLFINGDVVTRGSLKIVGSNSLAILGVDGVTGTQKYQLPNTSGTLATIEQVQSLLGIAPTSGGTVVNQGDTIVVTGVTGLNSLGGDLTIQGTTDQISVNSASSTITLSTPQNIATSSTPTFAGLSLNGNLNLGQIDAVYTNNVTQTSAGNNLSISAGNDLLTFTAGGRSFIFPTSGPSAQTICTTGISCASGGGQAVLLVPGSAQTDNSTDVSIFINDIGGGNILQLQGGGVDRFVVGNTGAITASGTLVVQGASALTLGTANTNIGAIQFKGSGSANTLTLQGPISPSTNTLTLPNETGTLCSTGSLCSGYAAGSGSNSYIQNTTTLQAGANFYIQSAAAGSIGGIIQGATSQVADLFQLRNSSSQKLVSIDSNGNQETSGYINSASGGVGVYSNLIQSSELFDDTFVWTASNLTVTGDVETAPNGLTAAESLLSTASNGSLSQSYSSTTTGSYTFSVWLKSASGTPTVNLRIDSTGGSPTTGTAVSSVVNTSWQRYSVTQNITGSLTAVKPTIILPSNGTTVHAWGAQLVYDTKPQVYVQTVFTTVGSTILPISGVVSNGSLYAAGNGSGTAALTLVQAYGGIALQVINDSNGVALATIDYQGRIASGTQVSAPYIYGGSARLSSNSLLFNEASSFNQVAVISAGNHIGLGTGLLIESDDAFCFGSCLTGGDITVQTGDGSIDGSGGNLVLNSGAGGSSSGAGGSISLTSGSSTVGTGGAVTISGGSSSSGNGGAISIQPGAGGGGGTNGAVNIATSVRASAITIGHATGTGTITLGQSTAAQNINIGSANATAGAQIINIGNGTTAANMTVSILSGVGTAGTGTLSLGNNTRVTTIDVGNIAPAAARTITVGGGNSAVVDTLNLGTGNTTVAGGKTIHIGDGTPTGSGSNLVTIGSTALTSRTTIQGGTGTGATPGISLAVANAGDINIGSTTQTGTIRLGQSTGDNTITIGDAVMGNGNGQTIRIGTSNNNTSNNGDAFITIGNQNRLTSIKLYVGTGDFLLDGKTDSDYTIGTSTTTGITSIGGTAQTGAINIGTGSGAGSRTVVIGSTANASTLTLQSGTGGILIPASLGGTVNTATYLCRNSSNQLTACLTTTTGSAFIQGGNSFGAIATLGTNDANSLVLRTNSTTRLTIDTSGNGTLTGNLTVSGTGTSTYAGQLKAGNGSTSIFPMTIQAINTFDSSANCVLGCYGMASSVTADNPTNPSVLAGLASVLTTANTSFTLSTAVGVYVTSTTRGAASTITNNYGIQILNQTAGTNDYGVYIAGADTYALWVDSGATRLDGTLEVQGASATFGATATRGSLVLHDGSGSSRTVTVRPTSSQTGSYVVEIPILGASDTFCLVTLLNCGGLSTTTLQQAYANDADGSDAIISLTSGDDSLVISNPASLGSDSDFVLKLQQVATGSTKSGLLVTNAGGSSGYSLMVNDDGTDTDTTPFIVDSSGNVGIGDTTPAALLSVGNGDLFQVNSSGAIAAVVGITTSGNILPNAAGTIDIGSATNEFRSLYIGDNNGVVLGLDQDATLAYDETTNDRVELTGPGATLFVEDRFSLGIDSRTVADNGVGASSASLTLNPNSSYVVIVCNDADGCTITMDEASPVKDGNVVYIINNSANSVFFSDSTGVSEMAGNFTAGQYDSVHLLYMSDRWIEMARSNN